MSLVMDFKDYYKVLGVEPNTPTDEIKTAYRRLARRYHPDVSKEKNAEQQFKEINEAWEVLQDPEKRKHYDQIKDQVSAGRHDSEQDFNSKQRSYHQQTSQDDIDFSNFFSNIFGEHTAQQAQKGRDIHSKIQIPLNIAFQGGIHTIQVAYPTNQNSSTLNVTIPKGVFTGSQIRLKGKGMPGRNGGEAGDLYLEINVIPYKQFKLLDKEIHINIPISPWEAALGSTIEVPTLAGKVNVKIPLGAQSGQKMRLKGKGLPTQPPGDQIITLQIQTPSPKNENERKIYEDMAKQFNFNPRDHIHVTI